MRTNRFKGNCLCKYTLADHSSCFSCSAVVVVNISCFSLLDGYPFTCPAFFYFLAYESCPLSYKMWTGYKSLFALNMVTVYP